MNEKRIREFEQNSESIFGKNLHNYYTFISWARFYPDLLLDLMKPETGGINLHLDQRIFLRCDVRFMNMYGTFSRGYGKCVSGDTLVFTDRGIKEIGEFFNYQNDDVETYYNTQENVVNRYGQLETSKLGLYNGKKECFNIKTVDGYGIIGTPNHRVLVMKKDGNIDFVKTEDIKIGDYVVINRNNDIWGNEDVVDTSLLDKYMQKLSKQRSSRLYIRKMPDYVNEDLALLYGYLLGCGQLDSNHSLVFTNSKNSIIKNYQSIMKKYFGVKRFFKKSRINSKCVINDIYLRKYLEFIGFDYTNSRDKRVPKVIMKSSKKNVAAFLRGVFDSSGIVNNRVVSLSSVSENLMKEIQFLLLNFGIISRVRNQNIKSKSQKSYVLTISGNDLLLFQKYIGFNLKRKNKILKMLCEKKHNTNKDIIPCQVEKVKNIINLPENRHIRTSEYWNIINSKSNLTYNRLEHLLEQCDNSSDLYAHFKELAKNHYYFSKVTDISREVRDTYDFHLPQTHSFVSNGFVSHNTFDEVLSMVVVAMLYPNIELALSAQTKENAADLLKSKWNEISKLYPLLKEELQDEPKFSKGNAYIEFKNGSTIDAIANAQSTKGQRRRRLKIEESALLNNTLFEDALEPVVEVPRLTVGKLAIADPMELNQQIHFFTTAGFRGSDEYQRSVNMVEDMENLKGKIVLGSNWQLPCWYGRGSNKSKILSKKKNASVVAFAQNYEQEWVGCADGALVNINKLMDCRTLTNIVQKVDVREEYYMGVDVARSQKTSNNKSSIVVARVIRSADKGRIIYIDIVDIINIPNILNFTAQAAKIKKVQKKYNAQMVVLDGNGLGIGLVDELLKDTIDPTTGESLGCWDTINDDNVPEVQGSPKILYNLKAQSCQNEIVTTFIDMVDSKKLRLLEKRQDNDFDEDEWDRFDDKIRPFVETDAFIEETANLKLKHLSNGKVTIEQVVKKTDKDRVSALIYVLWYINKFVKEVDNSEYDFCCFYD